MKDVIITIIITTTGNGMELIISRNQPGSTGVPTSRFANAQSYLKRLSGPGSPGSFFLRAAYHILEVKSPTKIVNLIPGITKENRQKDLASSALLLSHARYQYPE